MRKPDSDEMKRERRETLRKTIQNLHVLGMEFASESHMGRDPFYDYSRALENWYSLRFGQPTEIAPKHAAWNGKI